MSADARTDDTRIDTGDVPRAERCENCRFWYRQYVALDKPDRLAQCLRYPPAVVGIGAMMNEFPLVTLDEEYESSRFPVTAQDDWCGEWQPQRQPTT